MALRSGNAGYLLIVSKLPEDLRPPPGQPLNRHQVRKLFSELARRYPDRYRQISEEIQRLSATMAYWSGSGSFSVRHFRRPAAVKELVKQMRREVEAVAADDSLSDEEKQERIVDIASRYQRRIVNEVERISEKEDNPLYHQIQGAGRGNIFSLNSLRGSDVLYGDHDGRPIPVTIEKSYGQGLSAIEYLASAYGARQGVLASKFAIRRAGFLTKSMQQAAHRLVVTSFDRDPNDPKRQVLMLPVEADDPDNEGAVLAKEVAGIEAGTVLTPKHLELLKRKGIKKIYVRSPLLPGDERGGLYAVDVGIRENGNFPDRYSIVGLTAVQSLLEPVAQGQLNVRHSGGLGGSAGSRVITGFPVLEAMTRVPKRIVHGATHAEEDGKVERIEKAPAGGWNIYINGKAHYVPSNRQISVKVGDEVEAGDVLTDGIPSPRIITQYKGIGEGRRYFVKLFREALAQSGHPGHRRNIEIAARGLINHVRLRSNWEDWYENDIIPYDVAVSRYKARPEARMLPIDQAAGKFLEDHYLHYTIGTRLRKSVIQELKEAGIDKVLVHDEPPPFEPEMVGADRAMQYDEDWMVRLLGGYQEKSLLGAARSGASSSLEGTSFVPGRAYAKLFGRVGVIRTPQPWQPTKGPDQRSHSLWKTRLSRAGEERVVPGLIWEGAGISGQQHEELESWR